MGCGKTEQQVPVVAPPLSIVVADSEIESTWYQLPQFYAGVPKYSGAFGTYTNKHIPVSIAAGGSTFSVFSDNLDGNLDIYLTKDSEEPVLVWSQSTWIDPHMNAAVNVDPQGYVWVHVSARGLREVGRVYKSIKPYGTELEFIEENNEAYPQLHNLNGERLTMYSRYLKGTDGLDKNTNYRTLWSRVGDVTTELVKGGHYQVTTTSNETVYSAFNYNPIGQADPRVNLYAMKSEDGITWTDLRGNKLELPLEQAPASVLIHETESLGHLTYIKDIRMDSEGRLRILFTEATTFDPTEGTRVLREWVDGTVTDVVTVGHSYNTGTYLEDETGLYMLAGTTGVEHYSGGALNLYKSLDGAWVLQSTKDDLNYSYARATRNGGLSGVVSSGASDINNGGLHHTFSLK